MNKFIKEIENGNFLVIDSEKGTSKTVDSLTDEENNIWLLGEIEKSISTLRILYDEGLLTNLVGSVNIKEGKFQVKLTYDLVKEGEDNAS